MGFRTMFRLRPFSLVAYALYAIMGVVVWAVPTPTYVQTSGHTLTYVWAGILVAGGCLGVLEYFLESRISEIIGLLLLIVGTLSYGLVLSARAFMVPDFIPPYSGVIALVASLLLGNRLVDIYRLYRVARRI